MAHRRRTCVGALAGLTLAVAAPARAQLPDLIFTDGFEVSATFRISDLDLRDPHTYVSFIGCLDVTNSAPSGASFNAELQTSLQTDANLDGLLDLSFVLRLRPLDQDDGAIGGFAVGSATCSAPLASTSCQADGSVLTVTTYTSRTGSTCLAPLAGTTRSYTPAIMSATMPCFASSPATVTLTLAGIPVTLTDTTVAATYFGIPASELRNGLVAGFLSEAVANTIILPSSLALIGGRPLSALLPGGASNCAGHSDKDVHDGVVGWWVYLNFNAVRVDYEG